MGMGKAERWEYKIRWLTEINVCIHDRTTSLTGKILKSFSITQQTVVALLQNILAQFYSGQKYYGS